MAVKKKKLGSPINLAERAGVDKSSLIGAEAIANTKKADAAAVEQEAYLASATLTKRTTTLRAASKTSGIQLNGTEGADSLVGGAGGDTLNGAGGNDTLFGGDSYDRLNGGAGDDLLDGGIGSDALAGGAGNDTYIVDTTGDSVTELANEGIDTVRSSVSWSLSSNIENLTLTGTTNINGSGNTLNNVLIGNAGSNLLQGGAGSDTLDGGVNASGKIDTLAGGAGDDLYIVRNSTDVVREYANDGNDTVQAAMNHTLAANVENLVLTGSDNLTGTGNELANRLTGNDGANLLQGQAGNDTILGGAGADTIDGGAGNDLLTGGTGGDLFRFAKAGGQDTITDFNAAQGNLIDLTGTGITGLDKLQISFNGSAYVVGLGDGTTITVTGLQAPEASWFKFDPIIGNGGGSGGGGTGGGGGGTPSGGTGNQIFTWEGISLPSYWGGNFQTSGGLGAMDLIKSNGANTITMVPNFFMSNEYSNDVKLNLNSTNPWASESDTLAQVKQGIMDAKARGLNVVVKPHVETDNRVWRALIEPTDPKLWFQNYKNMMVEYAKIAQEGGAAMFVVGTEMKSMTDPTKSTSDGKSYTQNWIDIIDAVKSVFSGKITYAATDEEAMDIQFWDKVDYIGVDAYFSMTNSNTPTVQDLIDSWIKPATNWNSQQVYGTTSVVDTWKNLSEQWGKKVIFTEIGYGSYDGVNKSPGWLVGNTVDQQEQKDAYEALYHVMKNYGGQWLDGAFLWSYQASTSGLPATDYTTQGKLADAVIKAGYSSPEHVTGVVWNGTAGADRLDGGYNNDTLNGGAGSDVLWGGAGHDIIYGGSGGDSFLIGSGSGNDTIMDFEPVAIGEIVTIAKNVNGLDLSTFAQLMARTTMVGTDTVIDLGAGNSLKLAGIDKAFLSTDNFLFI